MQSGFLHSSRCPVGKTSIASEHQKSGLGTMLVNEALTQLESQGVALVFVLGYPDYYLRFGFAPAGVQGFDAPYPILPKNADAWMVKELQPGAIERNEGTVRCCTTLSIGKSESCPSMEQSKNGSNLLRRLRVYWIRA